MSLIVLKDINKSYPTKDLFQGLNLTVNDGMKIGLLGQNGIGKTTLLNMIAGLEEPDSGDVFIKKGLRIGYMEQEEKMDPSNTVFEETLRVFSEILDMERSMRSIEKQMSNIRYANDHEYKSKLDEQYDKLTQLYINKGGYEIHNRVEAVLFGLAFSKATINSPISELSGGQIRKIALAKLLLLEPDVMLLDEPTNHLDLASILWFEEFLKQYPKTFMLVSHDRWLLAETVNHCIEIEDKKAVVYAGGFDFYLDEKQRRAQRLEHQYELQRKEIRRQEEFIRRNIAAQKSKQAKSRRKMLQKMDKIDLPSREKKLRHIDIVKSSRGGAYTVRMENVSFGYDRMAQLFTELSLEIYRGESVALLGANGSGKTTLLRLIMGELKPDLGTIKLGHDINIGYFDQRLAIINPQKTVLEDVWDDFSHLSYIEMRGELGRFLFGDDKVNRPVHTLSGGEKSRLCLLKLILRNPNFLILDEPTNHLDVNSIEVIEEALLRYDGTVLVVSHDRSFLDNIVERILYLKDGKIEEFLGSYAEIKGNIEAMLAADNKQGDFIETEKEKADLAAKEKKQEIKNIQSLEKSDLAKTKKKRKKRKPPTTGTPKTLNKNPARDKNKKNQRLVELKLELLEKKIYEKEEKLAQIANKLQDDDTYINGELVRSLNDEYKQLKKELDDLYWEWNDMTRNL